MIRIGIDVGGTNTDAVVMDGTKVIAGVKEATTPDVMSGVVAALKSVLAASGLKAGAIDVVMIGTTHFTNAVVQRRDLAQTAAVRLGLPATASLPPMVDWPEDLRSAIGNHAYLAHGGHEFDGRVISPLDEAELLGIAAGHQSQGHPLGRDHLGVQSGQHRARNQGRRDLSKRRCRASTSRCRATSAASGCWSARTRR